MQIRRSASHRARCAVALFGAMFGVGIGAGCTPTGESQSPPALDAPALHAALCAVLSDDTAYRQTRELAARVAALEADLQRLAPHAAPRAASAHDAHAEPATHQPSSGAELERLRDTIRRAERERSLLVANIVHSLTPGHRRQTLSADGRVQVDDGPGAVVTTNRQLDVAIEGRGWFAVVVNGRMLFTRKGHLQVNPSGQLSVDGQPLHPSITLPSDLLDLSIDRLGTVSGRTAGSPNTSTVLGQIALYQITPERLTEAAPGLFDAEQLTLIAAATAPEAFLRQGHLELSDVDITIETLALQAVNRRLSELRTALSAARRSPH